jgi:uncharacterized protein (TIGR02118 family)
MIRLVTMLKRKPGTTHEEFLHHWKEVHGPLIASSSAAKYVRRYEQHPATWPPAESAMPEPDWDGVTVQEFDSVASFWAHTTEPDFSAIQEDIERFLDPAGLAWVLVEEPHIVIDHAGGDRPMPEQAP